MTKNIEKNYELSDYSTEIKDILKILKNKHNLWQRDVHSILQQEEIFSEGYTTFSKFINGNYSKVRARPKLLLPIRDRIEEMIDNPPSLTKKKGKKVKHVKYLVKSHWWLYHFNDNSQFIARSSLSFLENNKVSIINPQETNEKSYDAEYSVTDRQILKINVSSKDNSKELRIFIQLIEVNNPTVLLGQYLSYNVNSNIITGAVIIEKKTKDEIKNESLPCSFSTNAEDLNEYEETVDDSIRTYFSSKRLNFQKTPNKVIHNHESLKSFLDKYNIKDHKDDLLRFEYDFYISSPIYSYKRHKTFRKYRSDVLKIIELLKKEGYPRVQYVGKGIKDTPSYSKRSKRKMPESAHDHFIPDLINSKHHIVYFPSELISPGAFIEIGISLKCFKPIVIFHVAKFKVPHLLEKLKSGRKNNYSIQFHQIENIDDLLTQISLKGIHSFFPPH
jgi:hypothetical protein